MRSLLLLKCLRIHLRDNENLESDYAKKKKMNESNGTSTSSTAALNRLASSSSTFSTLVTSITTDNSTITTIGPTNITSVNYSLLIQENNKLKKENEQLKTILQLQQEYEKVKHSEIIDHFQKQLNNNSLTSNNIYNNIKFTESNLLKKQINDYQNEIEKLEENLISMKSDFIQFKLKTNEEKKKELLQKELEIKEIVNKENCKNDILKGLAERFEIEWKKSCVLVENLKLELQNELNNKNKINNLNKQLESQLNELQEKYKHETVNLKKENELLKRRLQNISNSLQNKKKENIDSSPRIQTNNNNLPILPSEPLLLTTPDITINNNNENNRYNSLSTTSMNNSNGFSIVSSLNTSFTTTTTTTTTASITGSPPSTNFNNIMNSFTNHIHLQDLDSNYTINNNLNNYNNNLKPRKFMKIKKNGYGFTTKKSVDKSNDVFVISTLKPSSPLFSSNSSSMEGKSLLSMGGTTILPKLN